MTDVKQAAERRREDDLSPYCGTGPYAGLSKHDRIQDWITLGKAYLAEHPADGDEPIDFDDGTWLQNIGFGEPTINGWPILSENGGCDPIELWLDYEGQVSLIQSNTNDHVLIGVSIKTRGQLRRLCAALNIPLTERT